VFAEDEAGLLLSATDSWPELEVLIARREAGEPLETILGWAEFHGLRIAVEPGVFVPRRRTGFLVTEAAGLESKGCVVVDLCCGSGAVGAAIGSVLGEIELYAVDIDPVAVRCAARNVAPIGGRAHQGDLFDALPARLAGRVDLLVANAPYVPTHAIGQLPPEARDHEPRTALDGGPDGLDVHRRIVAAATTWLAPNGHLLLETSSGQTAAGLAMLSAHGLAGRVATCDDLGATVLIGAPG